MLEILPIPAFQDNYIWLLHNGSHAVVIDPGDALPVIDMLIGKKLTPDAILITHHHSDHIDGVSGLLEKWAVPVYAPKHESYPFSHIEVVEGSLVAMDMLDIEFRVMETPGHTLGHVAYYGANCLFCGDTLFSAGCGRLFEGTPQQMYSSLKRFTDLPPETRVYCAHEYTERNLNFAQALEPGNQAIAARLLEVTSLRAQRLPSLPSTIGLELLTNPFLRCDQTVFPSISGKNPLDVFTAIRSLRNNY